VIPAALYGALIMLGIVVVWASLHPRPEPLTTVLGRLGRPLPTTAATDGDGPESRVAARLARTRYARAYADAVASDLRVLCRRPDDEVIALALEAVAGAVAVPVAAVVAALAGVAVPPFIAGWSALCLGAFCGFSRWIRVRRSAAARRDEFRYALSAFCDLTSMNLAAGRGISQSLETAARMGEGWAFTEIRTALAAAYERGRTAADGLEQLGVEVDIDDLVEVAGSIRLAGTNGAAVRSTLNSKARSIRDRLTTQTERQAAAVTERMGLPAAAVLMGLVAYYLYPAIGTLLNP
jgi:Flp pilus assembly protein TadB